MKQAKTVVYVVEDDLSFQKSLKRLIRASGHDVMAFDTAEDFLALPCIKRPSCLLLDVKLPDINGLDLQQRLIEKGSNLPIIFMTGHGTISMGVNTIKKGAIDFLPKPFEPKNFRQAVDEALKKDIQSVKTEKETSKARALLDALTTREKEVMRWVITGKLNKQIASALGTTEKTIRVHRGRVMHKTQCSSVAQLIGLTKKANISPAS